MTNNIQPRIMDNLTESQKRAVLHKDGPLLIIAGPGSGKTRVITHRIAALVQQGVTPLNICAVTFTNKASEEMRQRVMSMDVPRGVHISTFHSLCVRVLRHYHEAAGIAQTFSIFDTSEQKSCIREAVKQSELELKTFPPAAMLESISRMKNNLEDVKAFEERCQGDYFSKCILKIYKNYQKILTKNNAMDFDDLLLKTAFLLKDNADIRKQLNDRFKYLMVDEYQDTNHAQYQIARGLSAEHGNICVTGDPDQSIYGWRGADIGNILAFERDWPSATIIKLEENFRSLPGILEIADKLILTNKSRKIKRLVPVHKGQAEIKVDCLEDEQAEASYIAGHINGLIAKGENPNQIAIFYRVNSMSRAIEESFILNKIPYQVIRGIEFYNRKEIKDMLAYLRLIVNPSDDQAFTRIVNTPARGIGPTTVSRLESYAAVNNISIYQAAKNCSHIEMLPESAKTKIKVFVKIMEEFEAEKNLPSAVIMEKVFKQSGLYESLKAEVAEEDYSKSAPIDNVYELINSAKRFDEQQIGGLIEFIQHIALFSDTDAYDSRSGKVSLMTLHCAKGLEFDNVIIAGLEQGLLPHERSVESPAEMEEERRLFFVGITRAKKNLCVTLCRYRTLRGQLMRTIRSQFLFEAGIEPKEEQPKEFVEEKDSLDYDTSDSQLPEQDLGYRPGQLVSHKKFGTGRINKIHNLGADSIVEVHFRNGMIKQLMLKYANLTVIENK
ncbi:MAG: UvrD-helicase domain-containing protein [Phycisphaerales bacterium]